MDFIQKLSECALRFGITLKSAQLNEISAFYTLLYEKNKAINLTSVSDEDGFIYKHFLDSISIVRVIEAPKDMESDSKLIDVGTGAGVPGMILKMVFPDLNVTLLDSVGKKTDFLNEVTTFLKLDQVAVLNGRAEDIGHLKGIRESFDLVTSRAVAPMPVLLEYCLPFLKIGGSFIAYKSAESEKEILASKNALSILGGRIETVDTFLLPGTDIKRRLIKVNKFISTADKYPRRSGVPKRKPL